MIERLPSRWTKALRLLAMVCFALGQAAQPVLAAMGDLHQATEHDIRGNVDSAHGATDRLLASADAIEEEGSPSAMDTLLHLTHCCGQSPSAATPFIVLPPFVLTRASPAVPLAPVRHDARRSAPYRPPIHA